MSIESDFKEALFSYFGEAPGEGIVDNEIIRFGKHKEFWYVFHSDNITCGVFGNWKTGDKIKWSSGVVKTTTDADRLDMKRIIEAKVTGYNIHIAIMVNVRYCKASPKAGQIVEAIWSCYFC